MQYSTLTATGGLRLQNSCRLMVASCQTNSCLEMQQPKKLLRKIRKYEQELENLKTLPYYRLFKQETEQQKDIAAVTEKLEKLRAKYSVASRRLQLSA